MKTYGFSLTKFFLIVVFTTFFAKIGTCSATNDFFRTATGLVAGAWDNTSTWESSNNGSTNWVAANLVPTNASKGINIRSGATVSFANPVGTYTANKFTIDFGGTLNHTAGSAFVIKKNGTNPAFDIFGTYILNGKIPDITTNSAIFQVEAGGVVRVDDNLNGTGPCDDFAYDNTYKVFFLTDAVLQWNTTNKIDAADRFYFVNSPVGVSPVFRVSKDLTGLNYIGQTPGNQTIHFFGRFEVEAGKTVDFGGNGPKVFRDGAGGAGTLIHRRAFTGVYGNCGVFQFGSPSPFGFTTTPVIYGTVTINIEGISSTTDLEVLANATVTISGSPNINVGDATLPNGTLVINGTLLNNSPNPVNLSYGNLNITNTVGGTGTFTASSTATVVTVAKTTSGSAGSLRFTPGFNTVYDFIMGLAAPLSSTTSRIELGTSMTVAHNLTLTRGVVVTDASLLTWNNGGGTLTGPGIPYVANSTNHTLSFIATCDKNGVPLNVAGPTTPFSGAVGFRINNVSNADTYFPVAASFDVPGPGLAPAPNRMLINNQSGTPQDYTVIVNYGDIGYTSGGGGSWRVNRIWYVKASGAGVQKANMRLFFSKRDMTGWPVSENEVEAGFDHSRPALVQKNYAPWPGDFVTLSAGADIINFIGRTNNTEVYGQYTIGTSSANGIDQFNRFSVVNPDAIILPVSITNIKAYQKGNEVQVEWQALNEVNIERYEIERSNNAISFHTITTVVARNNASTVNNYLSVDPIPAQGKNFYRIKIIDKNSKATYTSIVTIDISNGKTYINVMPNPVSSRNLNLQLNNVGAGKYNLLLYSIQGKPMYKKLIEHSGGSSVQQIALPFIVVPGAYVLKLYNETVTYTRGIIVQ